MSFVRLTQAVVVFRGPTCLALLVVSFGFGPQARSQEAPAGQPPAGQATALIDRNETEWRYCDNVLHVTTDAEPAWYSRDFSDAGWRTGRGLMGYGDADIATKLCFGDDPQRKSVAALFRANFRLNEIARKHLIGGRICCDDGGMVWVNGREVLRHNLPSGKVDLVSFAVEPVGPKLEAERAWHAFLVPHDLLQPGDNLIAVSVHQATSTSSDLAMSLELFEFTDKTLAERFRQELDRTASELPPSVKVQIGPVARARYVKE